MKYLNYWKKSVNKAYKIMVGVLIGIVVFFVSILEGGAV